MTTGRLIKAARQKADMTQRELGKELGVSATTVCMWETGMKNPSRDWVDRIAAALGVDPKELSTEREADESNASFHVPLKSGNIAHTDETGTARWRDAVGLYGSPSCSNCGSGAALKTRFCPYCGQHLDWRETAPYGFNEEHGEKNDG